jgi:1-phosphatidylinositol-4-phosphate 5-kinase
MIALLLSPGLAFQPELACRIVVEQDVGQDVWAELVQNFDSTLVWVCFPFACLAFAFILYTHVKFPQIHAHPGDLILTVSIAAFVIECCYLASSIYYRASEPALIPDDFGGFCSAVAFFNIAGTYSMYIYNGLFYLLFIQHARNTALHRPTPSPLFMHLAALLLLAVIVVVAFSTGQVGLTLYGVCSLQSSYVTPFFEVATLLFFFAVSLVSLIVVGRILPSVAELATIRRQVLRYNLLYLLLFAVILAMIAVSKVTTTAQCLHKSYRMIRAFIALGNLALFAVMLLLAVLRGLHPAVWDHFFRRERASPVGHEVEMAMLAQPHGQSWMEELAYKYSYEFGYCLLTALKIALTYDYPHDPQDQTAVIYREKSIFNLTQESCAQLH